MPRFAIVVVLVLVVLVLVVLILVVIGAPSLMRRRVGRRTIVDFFFFYTILYYSYVEKSAICGCGPKNPPDDDNKTRLEPYGTIAFGISNPVPSRGHKIGRYTIQTQQDGGWLSDGGHGIIIKYLPEGEAKLRLISRKGAIKDLAGKKTPTGQTALKKELVLSKLDFKFSAHFSKHK